MDARDTLQHGHSNILMGPSSFATNTTMIPPPSSAAHAANRFQFSSLAPPSPSPSQSQAQPQSKPPDSLSAVNPFDGSQSLRAGGGGFAIDPSKKKRGRPRKYAPDGNIALRLAPTQSPASHGGDSGGGGDTSASEPPAKRNRGRPPGSGKRQLDALGKF